MLLARPTAAILGVKGGTKIPTTHVLCKDAFLGGASHLPVTAVDTVRHLQSSRVAAGCCWCKAFCYNTKNLPADELAGWVLACCMLVSWVLVGCWCVLVCVCVCWCVLVLEGHYEAKYCWPSVTMKVLQGPLFAKFSFTVKCLHVAICRFLSVVATMCWP